MVGSYLEGDDGSISASSYLFNACGDYVCTRDLSEECKPIDVFQVLYDIDKVSYTDSGCTTRLGIIYPSYWILPRAPYDLARVMSWYSTFDKSWFTLGPIHTGDIYSKVGTACVKYTGAYAKSHDPYVWREIYPTLPPSFVPVRLVWKFY